MVSMFLTFGNLITSKREKMNGKDIREEVCGRVVGELVGIGWNIQSACELAIDVCPWDISNFAWSLHLGNKYDHNPVMIPVL